MEVPITHKNIVALVDTEDYDRVMKAGPWSAHNYGHTHYVRSRKNVLLHRFIMNPPKKMVVNHENHDGLDNRKANLTICTYSEHQRKVRPYKKLCSRGILQKGLL